MIKKHWLLCMILIPSLLSAQTPNRNSQSQDAIKPDPQAGAEGDSALTDEEALKWKTRGFQQANTMGGGEAAIPKSGKFRVFVLMGQSNMTGAARAKELKPPYNQKHDRIRIWATSGWTTRGAVWVRESVIGCWPTRRAALTARRPCAPTEKR